MILNNRNTDEELLDFNVSINDYDEKRIEALHRVSRENPRGGLSKEQSDLIDAFLREYYSRGIINKHLNIFWDDNSRRYIVHNTKNNKIIEVKKDDLVMKINSYTQRMYIPEKRPVVPTCKMVMLPNSKAIDEYSIDDFEYYNTFTPNKYMTKTATLSNIDWNKYPAIDMLTTNLFGSTYKDRFINWVAFALQKREKSGVAWVSKTVEGAGKGVFKENILEPLFNDYVTEVGDSTLKSDFNGWQFNKLFICANEISVDYSKSKKDANILKSYITDKKTQINKKGVDVFETDTYYNMWFWSNNDNPVTVTDEDRRFIIIDSQNKLKDTVLSSGKYKTMREFISALKREFKAGFGDDIASLIVDEEMARTNFSTEVKEEVISQNKSNTELMLDDIENNNQDSIKETIETYNAINPETSITTREIEELFYWFDNGILPTAQKILLYRVYVGDPNKITSHRLGKVFSKRFGKTKTSRYEGNVIKVTKIR